MAQKQTNLEHLMDGSRTRMMHFGGEPCCGGCSTMRQEACRLARTCDELAPFTGGDPSQLGLPIDNPTEYFN